MTPLERDEQALWDAVTSGRVSGPAAQAWATALRSRRARGEK